MIDHIYVAFACLFVTVLCLGLYYEKKAKIGAVPTLSPAAKKMLALAVAHGNAARPLRIADLGCGWGGLLMRFARHYRDADITGYEVFPFAFLVSKMRAFLSRRDRGSITVLNRDFMQDDLGAYDLVLCYLSPRLMEALEQKFVQELKPGACVISNAFALPGIRPLETAEVTILGLGIPVYLYRQPLAKNGAGS